MRNHIEFDARGTTLRGWLYRPVHTGARAPAVVLAHGFSAVKEMFLDGYAEVFAAAGFIALVFDRRNLGASDGLPRQEVDPWADVADYRDAVSFLGTLPFVDRDRIALWGTSYGGGVALAAAALDRRVRCVVSQVPMLQPARAVATLPPPLLELLRADREARYRGAAPMMTAVCARDPRTPAVLTTPDVWAFKEESEPRAPAWRNQVTLRSVENLAAWDPVAFGSQLGSTPALVLVAEDDLLIPRDVLLSACERIAGPKTIVRMPGGHFDGYNPLRPQFATASGAAREFLSQCLGG
jgi:uncharacterized protein